MNDPGKIPVKIALNTTIISDEICLSVFLRFVSDNISYKYETFLF
jgi:hypothetical protein